MRSFVRVGATVLLAAALGACSSSAKPGTTTFPAPSSLNELALRVVTKLPAGFEIAPDSAGDNGGSDLAKATKDDGSPGARAAFVAEGFVRGYQRFWTKSDGSQIVVSIYQFKTQAGARKDFVRASRN
jgi:hypothetical protein